MDEEPSSGQAPQQQAPGPLKRGSPADAGGAAGRRLVRTFAWHLRAFLAANAVLTVANAWTGRPWWAFWPLIATGVLLAVHYLFYKAALVDERWVEERVEELNLKSYDRSHIEDLKARHGGDADPSR